MASPIASRLRERALPSLPVELLSPILQGVCTSQPSNSKRDLIACSEVSRTWREFALDALFAEVTLGFYDELIQDTHDDENQTSLYIVRPSYPTLSVFRDFLISAPYIASRIHNVTLACREYEVGDEDDSEPEVHYVSHRVLLSVLAHVPRLSVLKLLNVDLVGPAGAIRVAAGDQHPLCLEELHLRYRERSEAVGTPVCLVDITNVLNLFEQINSLFLGNVTLRLPKIRHVEVPATLSLRSLALDDVDDLYTITYGLRVTKVLRTLESLAADIVSSVDLAALRTVLDLTGANLRHFACAFASHQRGMCCASIASSTSYQSYVGVVLCSHSPELDALDLSCCHQLETLAFTMIIFNEGTPEHEWNTMQWQCAIRALSFLGSAPPSSPPLSIAFTMDATPLKSGTIAEHILDLWYLIDLAEDEIVRLVECDRRVDKVQVRIRQWGEYIHRDYGPHVFPKLRARGILVG